MRYPDYLQLTLSKDEDSGSNEFDGNLAVLEAKPKLKRPPMYADRGAHGRSAVAAAAAGPGRLAAPTGLGQARRPVRNCAGGHSRSNARAAPASGLTRPSPAKPGPGRDRRSPGARLFRHARLWQCPSDGQ